MLHINTDYHPIVLVFPTGDFTINDTALLEKRLIEVFERGDDIYVLTEARGGNKPDTVVRRELSAVAKRLEHFSIEHTMGSAVIVSNRIIAGAITAVNWFTRRELNPDFFATAVRAASGIEAALRKKGHAAPDGLAELLKKLDVADGDIEQLRVQRLLPSTPRADAVA